MKLIFDRETCETKIFKIVRNIKKNDNREHRNQYSQPQVKPFMSFPKENKLLFDENSHIHKNEVKQFQRKPLQPLFKKESFLQNMNNMDSKPIEIKCLPFPSAKKIINYDFYDSFLGKFQPIEELIN